MPQSLVKKPTKSVITLTRSASRYGSELGMDRGLVKGLLKPDDQLNLNEEELDEDIARALTTKNHYEPSYIVQWSYAAREFVKLPDPPDLVTTLDVQELVLHKDSEEAKIQLSGGAYKISDDDDISGEGEGEEDEGEEDKEKFDEGFEDDREEGEAGPDEPEEDEGEGTPGKPKKVPNQFNYCERAALTYDIPIRDMTTQTVPPPTANCSGQVYQGLIYDDYTADYNRQQQEKEKEKKSSQQRGRDDPKKKAQEENAAMTQRMLQAVKTLERMVNQNIFDDLTQDYRYWDDPSDEFKEGEGTLLPLWKLSYEKTKKHDVTDMCFNGRYYDLFAVAFGSMSFNNPMPYGAVCLFTLKNPSYPEWICMTESPVMCVDFNPQHPHLIVLGTLDGSVEVYNVQLAASAPQYKSNDVTQKHAGIVWQVCWAPETEEGNLTFFSVSTDGRVNHWVLNQNDLGCTTVMTLLLDRPPIPGPDGTQMLLKGCGTCIAFHPQDPSVYLVGTEEGTIYKCNTAYSSCYMSTYEDAHDMPIYRIAFNKFNSDIFASCAADWRIKIWEDGRPEPLFMFDLGVPIGDVQWAPYSSTVLACVSNDGKVSVFDLNIHKYRPICSQAVVDRKRRKPTRLAFNHTLPFIIVGDDKGTINTMKLSPNLRQKVKPTKKQQNMSHDELELAKLEKLLSFVREPAVLEPPTDMKEFLKPT
ncbi:hypothetical protein TKK_0019585 [Trichogramma kaykai]|uniref:Dynein intermediate chain 2, ciliary n=1 Tax=Trichogramma kaykai TaxID=54128 RepID=A0ABD2VRV4_9HYME